MSGLILPDTLDSKLLIPSEADSPKANDIYLRLRLQLALQILLGRSVLVSEGWALDSIPFLRVVSEVFLASQRLRQGGGVAGLEGFRPFVMEIRTRRNYPQTLSTYLERDFVRWSGMGPDFSGGQDHLKLSGKVRELLSRNDNPAGADMYGLFANVFGRADVAEYLANAVDYFRVGSSGAMLLHTPPDLLFWSIYGKIFDSYVRIRSESPAGGDPLVEYFQKVRRDNKIFRTSSLAMQDVETHLDDDAAKAAAFRIINASYMLVSSSGLGSDIISPAMNLATEGYLQPTEAAIVAAAARDSASWQFHSFADVEPALFAQLSRTTDWVDWWTHLMRLSLGERWREVRHRLQVAVTTDTEPKPLNEYEDFRELEKMVEEQVPSLTLRASAMDRLNLNFIKDRKVATVLGGALVTGGAAAAATGAPAILAGLAAAGAFLLTAALPSRFNINPFIPAGPFSKRQTVLDSLRITPTGGRRPR